MLQQHFYLPFNTLSNYILIPLINTAVSATGFFFRSGVPLISWFALFILFLESVILTCVAGLVAVKYKPMVDIIDENGKKVNCVQLGVRPIQLWEMVFPKEDIKEMLSTLHTNERTFSSKQEMLMGTLRKVLGAKKAPPVDLSVPSRIVRKINMECQVIGMKEDGVREEDGSEQL